MAEYTSYPIWFVVKAELLLALYHAKNYLKEYRAITPNCAFMVRQKQFFLKKFVCEVISLLEMLKPSYKERKKEKPPKIENLMQKKNPLEPDLSKVAEWIGVYLSLNKFMHDVGVTNLKREDLDEDEEF